MLYGNSVDVRCAELAVEYEAYLVEREQAQHENRPHSGKYSQQELQAMIDRVRQTKAAKQGTTDGSSSNKKHTHS